MIDRQTMWDSFSWPPRPVGLTHQLPSASSSSCLIPQDKDLLRVPFSLSPHMPFPGISSLKRWSPPTPSSLYFPGISFRYGSWAKERMGEHRKVLRMPRAQSSSTWDSSAHWVGLLGRVEPVARHRHCRVCLPSSNWPEIISSRAQWV